METDKRPFYIWIAALLPSIGMVLASVLLRFLEQSPLFEPEGDLVIIGVSLFITIVPVLISRSNSRLKNRFGYGIPILLLLPLPYFVYDYYTCTGKFCEIGPFILGWGFGLSAIIFAVFYTLAIYARKWTAKFVLSFIGIEIILFAVLALLLLF